jgi:hypothetical protein
MAGFGEIMTGVMSSLHQGQQQMMQQMMTTMSEQQSNLMNRQTENTNIMFASVIQAMVQQNQAELAATPAAAKAAPTCITLEQAAMAVTQVMVRLQGPLHPVPPRPDAAQSSTKGDGKKGDGKDPGSGAGKRKREEKQD